MGQEDLRAGLERKGEKLLIGLIAGGDGHVELEREVHGGFDPRIGHVVAVAHPGYGDFGEVGGALVDGQEVRHELAGMALIGEGVDHREGAVFGEFVELFLAERADDEAVHVAGEHAGGVAQGFGAAELAFGGGHEDGRAAELADGDVEGDARARGGFFKNERSNLAVHAVTAIVGLFHFLGTADDFPCPAVSEVADSHEMLWHDVLLYGRVGKSEKVMPGGRKSTLRTHFFRINRTKSKGWAGL